MELRGKLFSASSCDPIDKVRVVLFSSPKKAISKTFSDSEGYWFLEERRKYHHIEFSKPGYVTKKIRGSNLSIIRLLENKLFLYLFCRRLKKYLHNLFRLDFRKKINLRY